MSILQNILAVVLVIAASGVIATSALVVRAERRSERIRERISRYTNS